VICTFYSYKGGVGRSMAMANVADLLSRQGLSVLMVDFDLEAPGLEQFFKVNHDGVRRHLGLLDLLLSYKHAMSLGASQDAAFKNVASFIVPVHERLPGGGRLDLMPAGQRQDPEQLARYATSLRTFDWQDFYFDWQGGLFFEWLRRALVPKAYDLVLIDSRTGVTEMGGICGYQLADTIVMLCSANHQNIQGTRNMLRDFRSPAVEGLRRGRRLDIVVVPARIEQRDGAAIDAFYERFEREFGDLLPAALGRAGLDFRALTIPYEPHFAFEERIVGGSSEAATRPLRGAFDLLARAVLLLRPESPTAAPPSATYEASLPRAEPAPALAPARLQYDAAKRFANYDVFVDASPGDRELVRILVRMLTSASKTVFVDREDITPGDSWQEVVEEALFRSHALYFCIGAEGLSALRHKTLGLAQRALERGQRLEVVPVLLPGADVDSLADPSFAWLRERGLLDLRAGMNVFSDFLLDHPRRPMAGSIPAIEAEAREPFPGMGAFSEERADLFFGREASVQRLLKQALEQRWVVVVGPSGCGKSSLVEAGLIPALRQRIAPSTLRVVVAKLGPDAAGLLSSLVATVRGDVGGAGGPRSLLEATRAACAASAPGELLLFVDQLEEVFLLPDAEQRRLFLGALGELAASPPPNFCLLLSLRSSFLSSWRQEAGALALPDRVFEVPALSSDELRAAIEYPVERVGAAFEPGVVDRILEEIRGEPAALSLLQGLLAGLWRERRDGWLTNAALAKLGGVAGLLALQAEQVYAELPADHRQALRWLLLRLVRPGQRGEETRRRLPLDDLMPDEARRRPELAAIYRTVTLRLVEARVLISGEQDGRRMIEPAHEALVRNWSRLREWVAEELEFLSWRERLGVEVADWRNRDHASSVLLRDAPLVEAEQWVLTRGEALNAEEHEFIASSRRDHERRKRRVRTVAAVVALSTLSLVAGVALLRLRVSEAQTAAAWAQRREAEAQAQVAVVARAAAESERDVAQREREIAEFRLAIAEDTIEELRQTGETLRELAQTTPAISAAAKRAKAGKELKRLQSSIDQLQERVDSTKGRDPLDDPK
jgi:MinD-like ATPase involved in chromosome partitioning or flagellar assembly